MSIEEGVASGARCRVRHSKRVAVDLPGSVASANFPDSCRVLCTDTIAAMNLAKLSKRERSLVEVQR